MVRAGIADLLERAGLIARTEGDDDAARAFAEIGEQRKRAEINVLVLGQFKRGKSTLVNALLESDVMPTGALPLTGIVSAIRSGPDRVVNVRFFDGRTERIEPAALARYVTEPQNPANALGVAAVEIAWPARALRGLRVFDTPGIGSVHAHGDDVARASLPRADVAVLVVGPDPPIGAAEAAYARDIAESSERVLVVVNKADLASDALEDVMIFTTRTLATAGIATEEPIALSATRARAAQRAGAEDPDFARFVARLRASGEGQTLLERSTRRRALATVERLLLGIELRRRAAELPGEERAERRAAMQAALTGIDDRVRALQLLVDDDLREIGERVRASLAKEREREMPALVRRAAEIAREHPRERRDEAFEREIGRLSGDWCGAATRLAEDLARSDAEKYVRAVGEIEISILRAGCEALHLDASALAAETIAIAPASLGNVSLAIPTTGLEVAVAVSVSLLPGRMREALLRRRYAEAFSSESDALAGRIRYALTRELEPWRRAARTAIDGTIERARAMVSRAFAQTCDGPDATPEIERLERAAGELRALRDALRDSRPDRGSAEAQP